MDIRGFTKTTLLDYPGHVAATVFTGGCNMRCPYCHNSDLVLNPEIFPKEDEEQLLAFLKKRHGILSGVCITGGEPTLQPDLEDFIDKLKDIGYNVKLDTNGMNPTKLEKLIDSGKLDYVAMDIKAGRDNYALATGIAGIKIDNILSSVEVLAKGRIPYEFRTTTVGGIHTEADFKDIAEWLPKDCSYFIQSYKEAPGIADMQRFSFSAEQLNVFLDIVKTRIPNSSLRGVDQ